MNDVVRSHGIAIREIERILPSKANKAEINAGLSMKANIADISRTIAEIAQQIENKITIEDL